MVADNYPYRSTTLQSFIEQYVDEYVYSFNACLMFNTEHQITNNLRQEPWKYPVTTGL